MKNIIIYNSPHDEENCAKLRVVHSVIVGDDLIKEADKTVPFTVPYKVIDSSEIPADRTFRNAWEVDDSEITDGVGGELKAKADLSQAEANLIQENKYLEKKQTKVDECAEELANAEIDFKEKEAAAKAAPKTKKGEKKRDEAKGAQEILTSCSESSQWANRDLGVMKDRVSTAEEKVANAKKPVQQCLDALPLDKRSA